MTKAEKKTASILPVPQTALAHHEKTLSGPLREWRSQKRVPPVLLLTGSAGVGKRAIAHYLAQWALCARQFPREEETQGLFGGMGESPLASSESIAPCGECANCKRALGGTWVDFLEILPEDEEDPTAPLKIERFRRLKESLGFGAHEGSYRITLIPDAERMTTQAANSVLKILEEPPKGWIFLLTASDPSLLLPTIVSRCQILRLKPFSPEELEALLAESGIEASRRPICARLAQGSWEKALQLAGDGTWKQRRTIFQFLETPEAEVNALVDWASQEDANMILLLDQLEQLTSELVQWSARPDGVSPREVRWMSQDGQQSLIRHAETMVKRNGGIRNAREFWLAGGERLAIARHQIHLPLNRKILAQDILLPWTGE